jgi:hypothetical protein
MPNWPERYKTDPARTAAENGKGRVDGMCSSVGSMFDYSRKGDNVTNKRVNLTYSSVEIGAPYFLQNDGPHTKRKALGYAHHRTIF